MRSFMILLLICGSCVAQQSIDEFTQQQQPEKDNAVAKVKLTGTKVADVEYAMVCLLYTSPSPRDRTRSRMPSSA